MSYISMAQSDGASSSNKSGSEYTNKDSSSIDGKLGTPGADGVAKSKPSGSSGTTKSSANAYGVATEPIADTLADWDPFFEADDNPSG